MENLRIASRAPNLKGLESQTLLTSTPQQLPWKFPTGQYPSESCWHPDEKLSISSFHQFGMLLPNTFCQNQNWQLPSKFPWNPNGCFPPHQSWTMTYQQTSSIQCSTATPFLWRLNLSSFVDTISSKFVPSLSLLPQPYICYSSILYGSLYLFLVVSPILQFKNHFQNLVWSVPP